MYSCGLLHMDEQRQDDRLEPTCSSMLEAIDDREVWRKRVRNIIYIYIIFTQPLRSGRIWHKVKFLSGVKQVWIQSFPSPILVASPSLKNLVCPTILPIAGGRIIRFIPFPRVLVLCEMQTVQDLNSCRRVQFLRR